VDVTLEKIDAIRERTGVSYRKAKEALEATGGDVVEALVYLEKAEGKWQEKIQVKGGEVVERVKELIQEGNVTNVVVLKDGERVVEIPATIGAVGALFMPTLALLGIVAALATQCTIVVERRGERPDDSEPITDVDIDDTGDLE